MKLAFEGHQGFEEKSMADFITTATTGGGVFFQAGALSCTENAKSLLGIHTLFGVLLQGGSPKIDKNRFGKFTYHRKGDCYCWWLSDPALINFNFKLLKRLRP